MVLVKYEIKKLVTTKYSDGRNPFEGYNKYQYFSTKIVSKGAYKWLKNQGWELVRKKYYLWTQFSDWWRGLSRADKMTIIIIILTAIIMIMTGIMIYLIWESPTK